MDVLHVFVPYREEKNAKQTADIRVEQDEPAIDLTDLAGCQITMTLEQLLRFDPRFTEGLNKSLQPAPMAEV